MKKLKDLLQKSLVPATYNFNWLAIASLFLCEQKTKGDWGTPQQDGG